jgi:hypothetical protein
LKGEKIMATSVYMGYECDFKCSITGVGGEVVATPKELLTIEISIDNETIDWYAIKDKDNNT